jgi:hypothetical protein
MVKGPYLKDVQQEIHPILNLVFRVDQLALMTETRYGDISDGLAAAEGERARCSRAVATLQAVRERMASRACRRRHSR